MSATARRDSGTATDACAAGVTLNALRPSSTTRALCPGRSRIGFQLRRTIVPWQLPVAESEHPGRIATRLARIRLDFAPAITISGNLKPGGGPPTGVPG